MKRFCVKKYICIFLMYNPYKLITFLGVMFRYNTLYQLMIYLVMESTVCEVIFIELHGLRGVNIMRIKDIMYGTEEWVIEKVKDGLLRCFKVWKGSA